MVGDFSYNSIYCRRVRSKACGGPVREGKTMRMEGASVIAVFKYSSVLRDQTKQKKIILVIEVKSYRLPWDVKLIDDSMLCPV